MMGKGSSHVNRSRVSCVGELPEDQTIGPLVVPMSRSTYCVSADGVLIKTTFVFVVSPLMHPGHLFMDRGS